MGGLLVILPNLLWQYQHNWPVFSHMSELQETQLGNVLIKDFLMAQILMHLPALSVWLGGLVWLIFHRKHRDFRIFAWAFVLTLLLIILLRGKFYYTIAAYTILVVFGAVAWERWAAKPRRYLAFIVLFLILSNGLFILPFSLPVLKPDRMVVYDRKIINLGLDVMLKWEDGEVHDLPQDYADMVGWDELAEKVWTFYETLNMITSAARTHDFATARKLEMIGGRLIDGLAMRQSVPPLSQRLERSLAPGVTASVQGLDQATTEHSGEC